MRHPPRARRPGGPGPGRAVGRPRVAAVRAGRVIPQSRGSMTVARVLDPQPGERVLDMAAAPGAKTTHMAALMRKRGPSHRDGAQRRRADALRENVRAHARAERRGDHRRRARRAAGPVRPHPARPALLRPRHAPGPPRRALAQVAPSRSTSWRAFSASCSTPRSSGCGRAASGLLQLHDLARRRTSTDRPAARGSPGCRARRPAARTGRRWHIRRRRYLQLLPHRDGADGFFIAR